MSFESCSWRRTKEEDHDIKKPQKDVKCLCEIFQCMEEIQLPYTTG